jgi:hypothetical protein
MADDKWADRRARRRALVAATRVSLVVEEIDDEAVRLNLIREGAKVWLGKKSPKEVEQIAAMDRDKLREYVAQHVVDDINSTHPDRPAEDDV